jgi:hypothetical protein
MEKLSAALPCKSCFSLPLSLTPAKRLKLELAKGFEPLTL